MAIKLSDLKNSESPKWLQNFLKYHGSKPINTIVDLTNYIMFLYGIPNHAFDTAKSGDNLIWEMNSKFKEFTSLDGSKLKLDNKILMINNPVKALSLSFWGGEACAIDLNTSETIIELAVYDRTTVRQNSRQLQATTEAGIRLEKDIDPELIPIAFNHLSNLILENCHGQISSQIFDCYPQKIQLPQIEFNLNQPTQFAGIEIPSDFVLDCLTRLECKIDKKTNSDYLITPPTTRKDITQMEDLVEEVIRFWGYNKIPTNQPLAKKDVTDITPPENYLIDQLKDKLVQLGYDEVLTWPLVTQAIDEKTVIKTQNSINSEAIYLRQSLIPSLQQQLDQYSRYKLVNCQFFEIGKVFSKEGDKFVEKNALGIFNFNQKKLIDDLDSLKLIEDITTSTDGAFAEIILDDLPKPEKYIPQTTVNAAYELTSQIITLDANITLDHQEEPETLINKYSKIIGDQYLWEIVITDIYHDVKTDKYRYTFRVSYFNTDDKTAKELHLKSFDLK
jgi:phenylalanyl-tRNA synthetase beta chain